MTPTETLVFDVDMGIGSDTASGGTAALGDNVFGDEQFGGAESGGDKSLTMTLLPSEGLNIIGELIISTNVVSTVTARIYGFSERTGYRFTRVIPKMIRKI